MNLLAPLYHNLLASIYDNIINFIYKHYKDRSKECLPQCEHLHIHEWNEMIDLLEKMKTEFST